MTIAMTTVFPVPVAILAHRRRKAPPSPGTSIPTLSARGPFGQPDERLSAASSWQKKKRRFSNSSGSVQYSNSRLVIAVTPG